MTGMTFLILSHKRIFEFFSHIENFRKILKISKKWKKLGQGVVEKLKKREKLNKIEMKVMRILLDNYPRKPTKKELEYIEKQAEMEKVSEAFLNMFEDHKEDK